ncbi:MAG TPA: hypothetical protein VLJ68_05345 [Chitinophagaceae bacterium]|nr:hypothetical protein [Chitinophagaceae bacterium]
MSTIYNTLMTKYKFGGADKKGVYFDEENRRHLVSLREIFAEAAGNLADAGRKEEAKKLLAKCEEGMLAENIPYAMPTRFFNQASMVYLEAACKAGDSVLADKIRFALRQDLNQQKLYYEYMRDDRPEIFGAMATYDYPVSDRLFVVLDAIERKYGYAKPEAPPAVTPGPGLKPDTLKLNDTVPKKDTNR